MEPDFSAKKTIEELVPSDPLLSCEYCFTNIYSWRKSCGTKWAVFEDCLTAIYELEDEVLMPAGIKISPDKLAAFFDAVFPAGEGTLAHVPKSYLLDNPETCKYFSAEESRDHAEYLHKTENLAFLKGEAFHKKKNLVSQFIRNNPDCRSFPLSADDLSDCLRLTDEWMLGKDSSVLGVMEEASAIRESLEHFSELGIEGVAISAGGRICAFSVWTVFNGTCIVHYEKYDRSKKGSAQAINLETAKSVLGRCDYINREQDLGIEPLRKAKISYRPDLLATDFVLKRLR